MSPKFVFLSLGLLLPEIPNFSSFLDLVLKFSLVHYFPLLHLLLLLLNFLLVSFLSFLHRIENVLVLHGLPEGVGTDKGVAELFLVAKYHVVIVLVVLLPCLFRL